MNDISLGIEWLQIEDFRCFKRMELSLNTVPRTVVTCAANGSCVRTEVGPLTVFVAKNGMGKTAILDAIRILFGTYTADYESRSKVSARAEDIRLFRDGEDRLTQAGRLCISGGVILKGNTCEVQRELDSIEGARTSTTNVKVLSDAGKDFRNARKDRKDVDWPVLAFYGTGRLWDNTGSGERRRLLLKREDFGYENCLGHNHSFKAANEWLTKAVLKRTIDERDGLKKDCEMEHQLAAVTRAIGVILSEEGFEPELTIDSMTQSLAIKARTRDNQYIPVPIDQLSDGVKAAFGLASDIAFRCAKLNPHLGPDAAERTTGLVMIDEVDLHLHPAWQQKILNTLQCAFPRIQFLVTTHSPQVVSSVPSECIREIGLESITNPSIKTEGAKSSQILEKVFNVDSRVPARNSQVSSDLQAYRKLVSQDRWDSRQARELRARLDRELGTDPVLSELEMDIQLKQYQRNHR